MSTQDDADAPSRAHWIPHFAVGHPLFDAQHQALLAQCNLLADACSPAAGERDFEQAFERLKALAREHFDAEVSALEARGYPGVDDHRFECDEFEYLADEIATTANFDRVELQRFVTLWFIGHIAGTAAPMRDALAQGGEAG